MPNEQKPCPCDELDRPWCDGWEIHLNETIAQHLIPQDYHVHSLFSCDSESSMEAICRAAIKAGINELGFSDHFDLHPQEPFPGYLDLEAWWSSLKACQKTFAGELVIRAGIEVGEPHHYPGRVRTLLKEFPWDFISGALHWVGTICVFDHAFFSGDENRTYTRYFAELERLVTEGEFDILAHLDVAKRYGYEQYGHFQPQRYEEPIRRILRRLAERDLALEINTSTLRRSIQQPCPDATVLAWFLDEGGRWVTLGSDAHNPADVGFGLSNMKSMVRAAGFEGLARYELREPSIMSFDGYGG
ncbi:MAG: histidinol-phosphatase HisJ family protein [Anaerolineales bacterium]|nr:MAG: histidinol-phosphatase HisJ family protein [Anaerolineales bacterium]